MFITIFLANNNNNSSLQLIEFLIKHVELLVKSNIISTLKLIKENQYKNLISNQITCLPALHSSSNKNNILGLNNILVFLNKIIKNNNNNSLKKIVNKRFKSLSLIEDPNSEHLNQGLQGVKVDTRGKFPKLIPEPDDNDDNENTPNQKNLMDKFLKMQARRNKNTTKNKGGSPKSVYNTNNDNNSQFSSNRDNVFIDNNSVSLKDDIANKANPANFTDGDEIMKQYFEANSETLI